MHDIVEAHYYSTSSSISRQCMQYVYGYICNVKSPLDNCRALQRHSTLCATAVICMCAVAFFKVSGQKEDS